MIKDQEEEKDPRTNEEQSINKGVELMLRRDRKEEPKKHGFCINQTLTLLKRQFYFNVEFSWGRDQT